MVTDDARPMILVGLKEAAAPEEWFALTVEDADRLCRKLGEVLCDPGPVLPRGYRRCQPPVS